MYYFYLIPQGESDVRMAAVLGCPEETLYCSLLESYIHIFVRYTTTHNHCVYACARLDYHCMCNINAIHRSDSGGKTTFGLIL